MLFLLGPETQLSQCLPPRDFLFPSGPAPLKGTQVFVMTKHFTATLLTVDSAFDLERLVFTLQSDQTSFGALPNPTVCHSVVTKASTQASCRASGDGLGSSGLLNMAAQCGICGSDAALTPLLIVRLPSGTHQSAGRRSRRGAQQQRPHDGAFRQNQVAGRFSVSDFLFLRKVSFWDGERIEILPAVSGLSTQPYIWFY